MKADWIDEGAQTMVSVRDPAQTTYGCCQVRDALAVTESVASGNDNMFHVTGETSDFATSLSQGCISVDGEERRQEASRVYDHESISGESTAHFSWDAMDDVSAERPARREECVDELRVDNFYGHDIGRGMVVAEENSSYVDVFEDDEDGFGCQRAAATLGDNLLSDLGLMPADRDGRRRRTPEFPLAVMDDPLPHCISLA